MKNPVVIIGLGQIGGVFAKGFLSAGYPVYPVTFNMDTNMLYRIYHQFKQMGS